MDIENFCPLGGSHQSQVELFIKWNPTGHDGQTVTEERTYHLSRGRRIDSKGPSQPVGDYSLFINQKERTRTVSRRFWGVTIPIIRVENIKYCSEKVDKDSNTITLLISTRGSIEVLPHLKVSLVGTLISKPKVGVGSWRSSPPPLPLTRVSGYRLLN